MPAVLLASSFMVHSLSSSTFSGELSEVTASVFPSPGALLDVMRPKATSCSATRQVRFTPYKREIRLAEKSFTVRATAEEDTMTIVKVDEGVQHAKKCFAFGAFGPVFVFPRSE